MRIPSSSIFFFLLLLHRFPKIGIRDIGQLSSNDVEEVDDGLQKVVDVIIIVRAIERDEEI